MPGNGVQVKWDAVPQQPKAAQVKWDNSATDPEYTPEALQAKATQQAQAVTARPVIAAMHDPSYIMAHGGPKDPNDAILSTGTLPQKIHRAIGNTAEMLAPAAAPFAVTAPMSLAGSMAGGAVGSTVGKSVGDAFLPPDWANVAGDVGGIIGGISGAKAGSSLSSAAADSGGYKNRAAETFRKPYSGALKPWVPRLPFANWATEALIPRGEEGTITNPSMIMRGGEDALNPGDYFRYTSVKQAGGPSAEVNPLNTSQVYVIPEPRGEFEGENPGYMASIPRKKLPGLAQAAKPGAGTQLQQLGRAVIYAPPSGYSGLRSITNFSEEIPQMSADAFAPPQQAGEGTSAVGLLGPEAPRTNPSQLMMSEAHELARNQAILDNPFATETDRASARNMIEMLQERRGGYSPTR